MSHRPLAEIIDAFGLQGIKYGQEPNDAELTDSQIEAAQEIQRRIIQATYDLSTRKGEFILSAARCGGKISPKMKGDYRYWCEVNAVVRRDLGPLISKLYDLDCERAGFITLNPN